MQVQLSLAGNPLRQIVVYLINQLNNNGYLILEDRQIVDEIGISPEKLTEAMRLLQGLDPPVLAPVIFRVSITAGPS
ncbi:replication/maintenance protein RepL [Lacticaseibacillus paracasei subsp. paracasei]|nr:replication/maintenance protein RepL [Lacticaseibacillus paracasei]MDH7443942.1 replication/maintenance protein RepL [Lacticaseibacillus paracasei subsp. paracasei]